MGAVRVVHPKMAKLPWSKKKSFLYTPHSAPITNGILLNSKWAPEADRSRKDLRRVSFTLRRTSSTMSIDEIRAGLDDAEVGGARAVGGRNSDEGRQRVAFSTRRASSETDIVAMRAANEDKEARTGRPGAQTKGSRHKRKDGSSRRRKDGEKRGGQKREAGKSSQRSDCVADLSSMRGGLEEVDAERMESTLRRSLQEMEAIDPSDSDTDRSDPLTHVHRPFQKKKKAARLSEPVSEMHQPKSISKGGEGGPNSASNGSEGRTRLSLLLDEKIVEKERRSSQESSEQGGDNDAADASPRRSLSPTSTDGEGKPVDANKQEGRKRLSLLLDKKIAEKMRRSSQEDCACDGDFAGPALLEGGESKNGDQIGSVVGATEISVDGVNDSDRSDVSEKLAVSRSLRSRSRLSLLLDEKIVSRVHRESRELADGDCDGSEDSLPVVHKVCWN